MYNIFKRFFKKKKQYTPLGSDKVSNNSTISAINSITSPSYTINTMAGQASGIMNTLYNSTPAYSSSVNYTNGINTSNYQYIISFHKSNGSEIVRVNKDGSVTWSSGIEINEAAEAFAKAISIGAEMRAGITQSVKYRMRDSVFADLIEFAKEKGSLTAEDLIILLEASKIVEKLKGE